jgi:hypothetical protein
MLKHLFTNPRVIIVLICVFALFLRWPQVSRGLPYFYDEDEAHHFNRTVDMVKTGSFNPHYFHKPSLHFYLRMPVVAFSYLWSVKRGYIKHLDEIKTRDPYGIADYSFSASPLAIIKWNRAFSILLSILVVWLTWIVARQVTGSNSIGATAALIAAASPALVEHSATIGVDTLMALMCLLSVSIAWWVKSSFSLWRLVLCGLVCGLAISSKYNALPVAVMPIVCCLAAGNLSPAAILIALFSPVLGFLLGSPYILVSIPLFLDHLGYEMWHYAIAGHEGHTGEPGIGQAIFYGKWLIRDGVGLLAFVVGLVGIFVFARRQFKSASFILIFPVLYFLLMIEQRANFTRNMLVIIPFVAICAAIALDRLIELLRTVTNSTSSAFKPLICTLASFALVLQSVGGAMALSSKPDESRAEAYAWLKGLTTSFSDTAVAGQIQFAQDVLNLSGVTRVNGELVNPIDLYLSGFDRVIYGGNIAPLSAQLEMLTLEKTFVGTTQKQRIIDNPELKSYRFKSADPQFEPRILSDVKSRPPVGITIVAPTLGVGTVKPTCPAEKGKHVTTEDYCWLDSRYDYLRINNAAELLKSADRGGNIHVSISIMSPWPDQDIALLLPDWSGKAVFNSQTRNGWQDVSFEVPTQKIIDTGAILVRIAQVHAPASWQMGDDTRRLGIAVKNVSFGSSAPAVLR